MIFAAVALSFLALLCIRVGGASFAVAAVSLSCVFASAFAVTRPPGWRRRRCRKIKLDCERGIKIRVNDPESLKPHAD